MKVNTTWAWSATLITAATIFNAVPASAQAPLGPPNNSPITRPTLSPYLNMLNGGDDTTNYINFVRPQQQLRNYAGLLTTEVNDLDSGLKNIKSTPNTPTQLRAFTTGRMAPTGHATVFAGGQGGARLGSMARPTTR